MILLPTYLTYCYQKIKGHFGLLDPFFDELRKDASCLSLTQEGFLSEATGCPMSAGGGWEGLTQDTQEHGTVWEPSAHRAAP